ncbi:MAG: hypothetical protein RL223_467 [Pseudomonadota bacterium]|jgi:HD-GYP domain-containing protein (c-di-GMP phosphodiesterase class II)
MDRLLFRPARVADPAVEGAVPDAFTDAFTLSAVRGGASTVACAPDVLRDAPRPGAEVWPECGREDDAWAAVIREAALAVPDGASIDPSACGAADGVGQGGAAPDADRRPVPTLGALWIGFSRALDLAEGQPEGHALRSAWIALHIGQSLGLEPTALRQLCETVLLKDLGGSCIAVGLSALSGVDDRVLKPRLQLRRPAGWAGTLALLAQGAAQAGAQGGARGPHPAGATATGGPAGPLGRGPAASAAFATSATAATSAAPGPVAGIGAAPGSGPAVPSTEALWQGARRLWHCARHGGRTLPELQRLRSRQGAELARQLSLSEGVAHAIGALDEHWDGRGGPQGLPAEAIALGARIALLAQQTERAFATGGPGAALQLARRQSGRWFDPHLVQMLLLLGREPVFWEALLDPQLDELLLAHPAWRGQPLPDDAHLDDIAATFGLVADAKSPGLRGHSERVSVLCDAMALRLGLPRQRRQSLRRAAALHDLGKLGVSSLLLERPGPLAPPELGRVRQHVRHTRRLLSRIPGFEPLARLCGDHHERLDGTGYPCGLSARQLPLDARLLGVADLYDALVSPRPHRPALSPAQALQKLRIQADTGQIDGRCVEVLARVVRSQGADGVPPPGPVEEDGPPTDRDDPPTVIEPHGTDRGASHDPVAAGRTAVPVA